MKFKNISQTRTGLAILAAGLAGSLALTAAAQPTSTNVPPRNPGGPGAPGMPGGPGAFRPFMLDQQQRDLMRQGMEKHRDELAKLDEKMRTAQKELAKAILAEKPDDALIQAKAEAMSKVQAEQTMLRAKIFQTIVPTLKPEQKEQIENSPFALNMMMMGGGPPMRPGMGGGGPGR